MNNTTLYYIWGGLYLLCALFGFLPDPEALRVFLLILSALFFVPPGWLLVNALRQGDKKLLKLLRYISGGVLAGAFLLLLAGILSVAAPEAVGTFLHILMNLLCPPIVTSGQFALCLFLWGCLFFATFSVKTDKST